MPETTGNAQLQSEIATIERQLAEKREQLQQQQTEGSIDAIPHDKEMLHDVVGEMIRPTEGSAPQGLPTPAPVPVPTTTNPPATSQTVPQQIHQQVQALVNAAFDKSIDEAIKEAKLTNNAALIDAFHDVLVDELYDHLVERGKLKRF